MTDDNAFAVLKVDSSGLRLVSKASTEEMFYICQYPRGKPIGYIPVGAVAYPGMWTEGRKSDPINIGERVAGMGQRRRFPSPCNGGPGYPHRNFFYK